MSKRSRFLVDPAVQWALICRVAVQWCVLFACLLSIHALIELITAVGEISFFTAVGNALTAQATTLGTMLLLLPLFLRDTMKLSNRFAGPMYRLRRAIKTMSTGLPHAEVRFRKGDFWQQTADDFNALKARYESIEEENEALRAELAAERSEQVGV